MATSPTAAEAAAVPKLTQYVASLAAVKNPTAAQKSELATYQQRLISYTGSASAPVPTPTTAKAPTSALAGVPLATPAKAVTVAGAGTPQGTMADQQYYLTPSEYSAIFTGGSTDFVAQAQSVAAAAPAYNSGQASADYVSNLYNRLRVLTNAYTGAYNGPANSAASVVGSANLAAAIQLTQQQVYDYQVGQGSAGDAATGGVPIPYNQFVQGEGVYQAAPASVQGLLAAAAPAGAPMATSGGVYQPNAGTPAFEAALAGGAGTVATSPITASGVGTVYSAAVAQTGAAGGIPTVSGATAGGEGTSVSAGSSDAGSPAASSDLLSGTVAGFPLTDLLLLGGAALGVWYLAKHKGKKGK